MKNFEKNKTICRETAQNSSGSKSEDLGAESMIEVANSSSYGLVSGNSGFPKKCVCGSAVKIFTSESRANPGRPYFRCTYSRTKGHLFKWVEEAMYEEVIEMKDEGIFVVNALRLQVENMKEEVQGCKNEMRKFKTRTIVLFGCLCIVAIVIFCHMMFEQGESSLVFGS